MTTGSPSKHLGCPGQPQTPGQCTAGGAGGNPSENQPRVGSLSRALFAMPGEGPASSTDTQTHTLSPWLDAQTGPAWAARPQELGPGYP